MNSEEFADLKKDIAEIKYMLASIHQLYFNSNPKPKKYSKADEDKANRSAETKAKLLKLKR